MFVSGESAGYFLNTFHGRQDRCEVAILILSTDASDLIGQLIDRVSSMDIALGDGVGLFLFGSAAGTIEVQTGSTVHLVPGSRIETGYKKARDFFANSSSGLFIPEDVKRNIIARSSRISVDFCQLLGVDPSRMPGVCILFRGWEEMIFTAGDGRLDFDSLSRAGQSLRDGLNALSSRLEAEWLGVRRLAERIERIEAAQARQQANREGALNALKGLERRYGFVVAPQVQAMFETGTVGADGVAALIREQRPEHWTAIAASGSWKGAARSIAAWEASERNAALLTSGSLIAKAMSRREYLERFGDEVMRVAHAALDSSGLSVDRYAGYRVPMSKASAAIDFASKAAQLLGKLTALKALL